MDSSSPGKGPVVGYLEYSNEPFGSIKGKTFLDQLRDC